MTEPGDVLDLGPLGVQVEMRRPADQTAGEMLEFDVVGRARGFLAQPHVHTRQVERLEVLAGSLELRLAGGRHRLMPRQAMEVPPGTVHSQRPGDAGEGRIRTQVRPAGRTEEFLVRLAEMSARGEFLPGGWPRPLAAADLRRRGPRHPSLRVQKALAGALLRATSNEYLFVDEWDVAAPPEATFAALADARSYPKWWRPVYLDVDAEGPPALGKLSRQHFKGRPALPPAYTLEDRRPGAPAPPFRRGRR